jgi:hypothetical protein
MKNLQNNLTSKSSADAQMLHGSAITNQYQKQVETLAAS